MKPSFDRAERLAWIALVAILIGLPLAALGYQFLLRPRLATIRTIDIVAAAPENGGFQPDTIRVNAGETVRLRFSAPDVTHGLAIGPGLGLDFGQIDPGQVKEVEVTFSQSGRYTLYCNTWCSPNHWRMRSVIEVVDPVHPNVPPINGGADPVVNALIEQGIDIDAPHIAPIAPGQKPSVARGITILAKVDSQVPADMRTADWRRSHSPAEAAATLINRGVSAPDAWDAVAALWLSDTTPTRLATAADLYRKNCAACHGLTGNGDGPGAAAIRAQGITSDGPIAFANPQTHLGGTGNIYYGKIRRGGMGTGMPGFGTLFTPEETWLLVDYLWTFVFEKVE